MSHTDSKFVESFFNCSWVTNSGRGFEPFCNINVHKTLQSSLYILFSKDAIIHLQVILLVKKALQECWLMTFLLSSRFFQVFFLQRTHSSRVGYFPLKSHFPGTGNPEKFPGFPGKSREMSKMAISTI